MDYIIAMRAELADLQMKHDRLSKRIDLAIENETELSMMRKQLYVIKEYIHILNDRIKYAESK